MTARVVAPPQAEPRLSVVTVLYRGGREAVAAIAAIVEHTSVPYEVIVVDNASPDASGALVRLRTTGVRFVVNDHNLGFGGGMNQAVGLARADAVCLLNPDVVVGPGWAEPLLAALDTEPRLAAVSPVLLDPDGGIQEAGATVDATGHTNPITDLASAAGAHYASAACLVVRRTAFEEVGGFDPRYFPAYFEDVDLALRWRDAGWTVRVEPSVRVVHLKGATDTGGAANRLAARNLAVFRERWVERLASLV